MQLVRAKARLDHVSLDAGGMVARNSELSSRMGVVVKICSRKAS